MPGLIVEKLAPNFLDIKLSELREGSIIVVGTNGKTTTTKMLTHVLKGQYRVLTNPTGSNFTRGIVASIVEHASWLGKLPFDIAVLELDEAYAVKFVEQHRPRGVVILNVMRDQMDRFAEIDQTARMLEKVAKAGTEFVVLNNDDTRIAAIANTVKTAIFTFGVSAQLKDIFLQDDELHDGPAIKKTKDSTVVLQGYTNGTPTYVIGADTFDIVLASHGAHNAQNAAAVLAACTALQLDSKDVAVRLSEVQPAFGRGELFTIHGKKILLQLVKNPGGFRHALLNDQGAEAQPVMIAINDDYPDGRDVSWLWDVNFDALQRSRVMTSGVRAADMALRLKYDDISVGIIEEELGTALHAFVNGVAARQTGTIYATYTAMLALRQHIAKLTEVEQI